jgi:hypothetical protein
VEGRHRVTGRGFLPAGWRWEAGVIVGLLAIIAAAGSVRIFGRTALGWDEAVYASKARSLVSDIPAAHWAEYRPPVMPLLGVLAAPWDFSEHSLRAITLVLGLVTLVLVWALARQVWGRVAGVIALAAVVGAPVVHGEIPQFHNDLASSGVLIALMLVLWDQFERRPAPTALLLAVAPIAAAAFYLRYGTVLSILVIGGVSVLLWGSRMRRHIRLVGATLVIGLLLAVPHWILAIESTGSPVGILFRATEVTTLDRPEDAFRQYLQWIPSRLAGPIACVVLLLGVLHAIVLAVQALRRRAVSSELRRHVWILGTALGSAALIVVASHAEPRYGLFPLTLGIVAGAGAIASLLASIRKGLIFGRRSSLVARASLIAVMAILVLVAVRAAERDVRRSLRGEPAWYWTRVGALIAADADGPCRVIASSPPLVGWYSACEVERLDAPESPRLGDGIEVPTYIVLTANDRREFPDRVAAYMDHVAAGRLVALDGGALDEATVYRVAP